MIYCQDTFWKAASKYVLVILIYLIHILHSIFPYLVVILSPVSWSCAKAPDLGQTTVEPQWQPSSTTSPARWSCLTWWTLENPQQFPPEGNYPHVFRCSHDFPFRFTSVFSHSFRPPLIGGLPILSHDVPMGFSPSLPGISCLCQLIFHVRPSRCWPGRAMPSGVVHSCWARWAQGIWWKNPFV